MRLEDIRYIGISGIIGAGKTTLTRQLSERLGVDVAYEPVETNPYLTDFYRDRNRWAFEMQMFLLVQRYVQHQGIVWSGRRTVQDRTVWEDTIFAEIQHEDGHIDERSYATYRDIFEAFRHLLVFPDLFLYLRVEPETALERVKQRGRVAEQASQGVDLAYLERLYEGYEEFFSEMKWYTTVLTIDWNGYGSVDSVLDSIRSAAGNAAVHNGKFGRTLRRP
jgi:deoxyadenosine/deoxycytidine kinase